MFYMQVSSQGICQMIIYLLGHFGLFNFMNFSNSDLLENSAIWDNPFHWDTQLHNVYFHYTWDKYNLFLLLQILLFVIY